MTSPSGDLSCRLGDLAGEIATIDVGQFLCGPDGDPDLIVIDDIFATPLDTVVRDWWEYAAPDLAETDLTRHLLAILEAQPATADHGDDVIFVPASDPDMLFDQGVLAVTITDGVPAIVGAYVGHSLAVDAAHGRRGIGRTLVIERFLQDGAIPAWHEDTPGFSRAGHATHVSAFRTMQDAVCEKMRLEADEEMLTPAGLTL